VREGGGIDPDTVVSENEYSKVLSELSRKAMFFKYANRYAAEHKTLSSQFEVTDEIIADFEKFIKERKFTYQEETEQKLRELRELAQKSRYGSGFFDEAQKIAKLIEAEKARTMERYKKELRSALKTEIVGRMRGDKARIETTFDDDPELRVATGILKNKKVYQRLLAAKNPQ